MHETCHTCNFIFQKVPASFPSFEFVHHMKEIYIPFCSFVTFIHGSNVNDIKYGYCDDINIVFMYCIFSSVACVHCTVYTQCVFADEL